MRNMILIVLVFLGTPMFAQSESKVKYPWLSLTTGAGVDIFNTRFSCVSSMEFMLGKTHYWYNSITAINKGEWLWTISTGAGVILFDNRDRITQKGWSIAWNYLAFGIGVTTSLKLGLSTVSTMRFRFHLNAIFALQFGIDHHIFTEFQPNQILWSSAHALTLGFAF
ncbi:MAG: hypothetical protein ACRCV0_06950 [Brevinema sp.]